MEKSTELKEVKLPRWNGYDILTMSTNPDYQFAAVIEVQEGNSRRFEMHCFRTRKSARACVTRELNRYDQLGVGASGRTGELTPVPEQPLKEVA
jgi:hypothetical protein